MNVFVSQPMRGLTDAEIVATRERVFGDFQANNPDAVLLDSYDEIKLHFGEYESYIHPKVAMLGVALQVLADADAVLFVKGWENFPGCRIEERVATYYDIPKYYVR